VRAPDLSEYLRAEAARPFAWGTADCATFIAGWIGTCRGIDPRPYYPQYEGEAAARALTGSPGGIVRLAARAMRQAGIRATHDPEPGDVAVVRVGERVACAIRTGRGWAVRGEVGLALLPPGLRVLASWRV
jgi:hypothetical protein